MSLTSKVARKIKVSERHARRLLESGDSRAELAVRELADPFNFAVGQAVQELAGMTGDGLPFQYARLNLTVLAHKKKLSPEVKAALEAAQAAGLAIEESIWRAVPAWHRLDELTAASGELEEAAEIVRDQEGEQ